MKNKIIIISILIVIAVALISYIFVNQWIETETKTSEEIFYKNIISPDRIVYRNEEGDYYEFIKDTEEYLKIKEIISKSLISYTDKGTIVEESKIKEIQKTEYIQFDYKTASKNYIIPLENKENIVIKLEETGGKICVSRLDNIQKIKDLVKDLSNNRDKNKLEYKTLVSKNTLNSIEYKYLQQFKEINYKIHQVRIKTIEEYEKYKQMCNLAFDEKITEDIFKQNELILTLSLVPKIDVEVNLGNIKYTYNSIENYNQQYMSHLLIVDKIVNTECIYNKDLTEISAKVDLDNMKTQYDKSVDNLDKEIFVTDFDKFSEEYEKSSNKISESEAQAIAEKGFEEAKRVAGEHDKSTQVMEIENINPNNFFTRKSEERDWVSTKKVEVYSFKRNDDMGNGIKIYVDKKLGKIVGAGAFGD